MCFWKDASVSLFGRGCWRTSDKKRASFFVKAHNCSCLPIFFLPLWLFSKCDPQVLSLSMSMIENTLPAMSCVAMLCIKGCQLSLILSKHNWGERSLKWSEVVIVNVEPIFIVQRPLVSSVAMLLRLASPLTLELTKLKVTHSMQHPGVQGESSGDHDLAISLTNLASYSNTRQNIHQVKFLSNATLFSEQKHIYMKLHWNTLLTPCFLNLGISNSLES